jgi:hypothetical protein
MSSTTLPARMREAADTIAEANALYGFSTEFGMWNPASLRYEAVVIEKGTPDA